MVIELGYFHDDIVPDGKMTFETSLPKGERVGEKPHFTPQGTPSTTQATLSRNYKTQE